MLGGRVMLDGISDDDMLFLVVFARNAPWTRLWRGLFCTAHLKSTVTPV